MYSGVLMRVKQHLLTATDGQTESALLGRLPDHLSQQDIVKHLQAAITVSSFPHFFTLFIFVAGRGRWKILCAVATEAAPPPSRHPANWMHGHVCRQPEGQMDQIRFMRSVFPANKVQIAVCPVITFLCLNGCETDNPAFGGNNTDKTQTLFL